jgi:8-oxo-dGTP pyrophosphatase MutT (NUDIX family)
MRGGDYACAIFWREQKILLGKRSPHRRAYPNVWDILGGKKEEGESLEQALTREMREEIGVTPRNVTKLTVLRDPMESLHDPMRYHIYRVDAWDGGEPALLNHEHTELRWFSIADACAQPDLALPEYRNLFKKLVIAHT